MLLSFFILRQTIHVAVPSDVYSDYIAMLDNKNPVEITSYEHEKSRRDVVEVILFHKALNLANKSYKILIMEVPSYKRIIVDLQQGRLHASGTSAWRDDIQTHELLGSETLVKQGEFEAGFYVNPNNTKAMKANTLQKVKLLSFVSSNSWVVDWLTLTQLDVAKLVSVPTWPPMPRMVNAGRVDALLAPFQANKKLELKVEGATLVPIPGVKIGLASSRHFAISKTAKGGEQLWKDVNIGLLALRKKGEIRRAYEESGFFNASVKSWNLITP